MNKKWLGITGVVVLVIGLIIISSFITPNKGESSTENIKEIIYNAQEESEKVKEEEQKEFIEINIDEYLNKYNGEEKTLVLIGRPTCHYCQIAEPILHNIAYNYDITINYLNTDNFQNDDGRKLVESDQFFSEGFGTPLLLVVSNGNINDKINGLTDTKHYKEFLKENGYIN